MPQLYYMAAPINSFHWNCIFTFLPEFVYTFHLLNSRAIRSLLFWASGSDVDKTDYFETFFRHVEKSSSHDSFDWNNKAFSISQIIFFYLFMNQLVTNLKMITMSNLLRSIFTRFAHSMLKNSIKPSNYLINMDSDGQKLCVEKLLQYITIFLLLLLLLLLYCWWFVYTVKIINLIKRFKS